jgi:pimeloyl-ACP methyl ester carboxylesterase
MECEPPAGLPEGIRCLRGQDALGAHYLIAVPKHWSGVLVVHAHGGPPLGEPKRSRADDDIKRWAVMLREGHAWAASVFRTGGFAVHSAAEDTENVRRIFLDHVATPGRTLLHGQSWGAMVAAKAAELFAGSWDGMLLSSGAVGGPLAYDFRLDLRALYQYLCNNHPRPDEPQYPLSVGLPKDDPLTESQLAERVNEALGVDLPAERRSPDQARRLRTIVNVLRIPEDGVADQLRWATFTLRDVVAKHGGSPVGNETVRYVGSDDDDALNAGVLRYAADPVARARFSTQSDYVGRFAMPVLTVHGIRDTSCFVEVHDTLRRRMRDAGCEHRLVQTFVDSDEHSYLGDTVYPPLVQALVEWIDTGIAPTPQGIAQRATAMSASESMADAFVPAYHPQALGARIQSR